MRLEKRVLTGMGVTEARADRYLPDLGELLPEHGIDTPLRIAHFLAQVLHESGLMRVTVENLNYTAQRLREVFPSRFTPAQAQACGGKPELIGNRVYGGRLGNGPDASGDGFRFRGRGLIQLTGKAIYREFSDWVEDADVVNSPDLVADRYAAHSAVFYWSQRDLNDLADSDDVRAVTKRVNGGFNGLADRMQLLDRAKSLLRADAPAAVLEGATHTVNATQLNLRSEPRVAPATRMATLAQGSLVAKIADATEPGWVRVRVVLNGQLAEGFVKSEFLRAVSPAARAAAPVEPITATTDIPPVHLQEGRSDITRQRDGGQAFPLGEPGMPRRTGSDPATKVRQLLAIVDYLDTEKKAHARYGPKTTATYCNIYAYDYCYLARVYLPRVFWTPAALLRLRDGEAVPVRYDDTVRELSANGLHDWLADFGVAFGWARVMSLDVLQATANVGDVCLIVAKRKEPNRSGHIVAVIAEQEDLPAARGPSGEVLRPVESEAGAVNHRMIVQPKAWWRDERFQSFAFWRHA
jgi:predicted chitinase